MSPDGLPLGLLHHQLWARQGRGTQRQRRVLAEKESQRWIESLHRTEALLSPSTHLLTIADREADFYELFACERRPHSDYLIRVHHDRQVKVQPTEPSQSLQQLLRETPVAGYLNLALPRTPRRAACTVVLQVKWVSVWLQPPSSHPQREQLDPVPVQVLSACEVEGDQEGAPIHWLLVTTLPLTCFEQAQQLLEWYRYRWLIERYHYTLKSGCRVEHLQLETFERLQRAIATFAIVAWRLLWLTYLVRPLDDPRYDLEADLIFETVEWQALRHYAQAPPSAVDPPGLQQCLRWLAQLGGFLGRQSDGDPGSRTLWRGLRRLRDLVRFAVATPEPLVPTL